MYLTVTTCGAGRTGQTWLGPKAYMRSYVLLSVYGMETVYTRRKQHRL